MGKTTKPEQFQQILGIRFFTGDLSTLIRLTEQGGLVVVPSAPVLVDLLGDPTHRQALEHSDIAITDSGYMVLLWRLLRGQRLPRISGLRFLRALLPRLRMLDPSAAFWIMPSAVDAVANRVWLKKQGVDVLQEACYVAPIYPSGSIEDPKLRSLLEKRNPRYIFVNLGGGVQERLGYYLRQNLSVFESGIGNAARPLGAPQCPAIICTGAAIAFLSGQQANIPPWADRLVLGWLMRTLQNPKRFVPRYWRALRLAPLLWQYGIRSVSPAK